ncbi:MAG: hypothetical protein ACT4QC_14395 [Planctomycetaceae bacterium]
MIVAVVSFFDSPQGDRARNELNTPFADIKVTPEQEAEIRALIEQLVLADRPASNEPIINPTMKMYGFDEAEIGRLARGQ